MTGFDPWTASLEEGIAHFSSVDGISAEHMRWLRARAISSRKDEILAGPGRELLDAVAECMRIGLAIPPWMTEAFLKRHGAIVHHRASSWDDDEAFGPPHPGASTRRPSPTQLLHLRQKARWAPVLEAYFRLTKAPRTQGGYERASEHFKGQLTAKQVKTLLPKTRRNQRGRSASAAEYPGAVPSWNDPFQKVQRSRERRK